MPYRRLPNTDRARLRAIKAAYQKGKQIPPFKLAFSQNAFQRLQSFYTSFEQSINNYNNTFKVQTERNKEYILLHKKAKLYVSHFIQVMNLAVAREELKPEVREFYGIDKDEKRVPSLNTEKELVYWGEKIIEGETTRTFKGQTPITNPTIAVVRVRFENFKEALNNQKVLQQNSQRALKKLSDMRTEADQIILQVWNEVEASFKDMEEKERLESASEYGVVYVYRKSEKAKRITESSAGDLETV